VPARRRGIEEAAVLVVGVATSQLTAGAVMLTLAAPLVARQAMDLQTDVVVSVLALGTGIAYMLNFRLIQDEGATTASTVTYLLPIVAVTLGAAVLDKAITWNLFAGTIIVLAGVALSGRRGTSTLSRTSQRPAERRHLALKRRAQQDPSP
jgi:drug/metabolite transporter (DMT)-like permease